MSQEESSASQEMGMVGWQDLTVPNAVELRDFYAAVVGWRFEEFDGDYNMISPATGQPAAGICHAAGVNADLPPQWMMYIRVDDIEARAAKCVELGGRILKGPTISSSGTLTVIQDPAGAYCTLLPGKIRGGGLRLDLDRSHLRLVCAAGLSRQQPGNLMPGIFEDAVCLDTTVLPRV